MSNETLEEAAENHQKNTIGIALPKHTFIEAAKWQQERMYSEKEVRILFSQYKEHFSIYRNSQILNAEFQEWFEQFKKK